MEFLKDIALPQSLAHYRLLVFISGLSAAVCIPYISYVLGSSLLSLWCTRKGRVQEHAADLQLAHVMIDHVLYNKSLMIFCAILPGLSLVLSSAQMLQGTPSAAVSLEGFGFLFLLAGLTLLYMYKYAFRMQQILGTYQQLLQKQTTPDAQSVLTPSPEIELQSSLRAGKYGSFFLLIAILLYAAAVTVMRNPLSGEDDSIFSLFFSLDVWLKLIELLLLGTGMSGIGMLFFSFAWNQRGEYTEEYSSFVRNLGIRLSMIGLIALPLFVLFNLAAAPDAALSGTLYSLSGFVILAFFLAAHFLYGYHRSKQPAALTAGFILFLCAACVLMACDYAALGTASRTNAVLQASHYDRSREALEAQVGVAPAASTGEDIYNARCFACHLFDQKKVGPPYLETIPKYQGKKAELVSFILNPRKVNPAYPPMPGQGLKPVEADSIAGYLLRIVAARISASTK